MGIDDMITLGDSMGSKYQDITVGVLIHMIKLHPDQRRLRWSGKQIQSFIESLLTICTVTPITVQRLSIHSSMAEWYLIDGQQRRHALDMFISGKISISLNGQIIRFHDLQQSTRNKILNVKFPMIVCTNADIRFGSKWMISEQSRVSFTLADHIYILRHTYPVARMAVEIFEQCEHAQFNTTSDRYIIDPKTCSGKFSLHYPDDLIPHLVIYVSAIINGHHLPDGEYDLPTIVPGKGVSYWFKETCNIGSYDANVVRKTVACINSIGAHSISMPMLIFELISMYNEQETKVKLCSASLKSKEGIVCGRRAKFQCLSGNGGDTVYCCGMHNTVMLRNGYKVSVL